MYVIAGLGNPGSKYENTRHNMGYMAIDRLAEKNDIKINKIKHKALTGDGRIAGKRVILVKPQTFMNLSGESIREVVDYYGVDLEDLIILYDDFDLEAGYLRIRKKGSGGSHNGMKSIVQHLHSRDFPRVRIGIGSSGNKDWVNFVIGKVGRDERKIMAEAADKASDAVECMLREGIDIAMNRFNIKPPKPGKEASEQKRND